MITDNDRKIREANRRFQARYNLSLDDYAAILHYQGGGCAICGRKPGKTRLHLDHDHKSMVNRGLLCFMCNVHIVRKIDLDKATKVLAYLLNPPAIAVVGVTHANSAANSRRKKRRVTKVAVK